MFVQWTALEDGPIVFPSRAKSRHAHYKRFSFPKLRVPLLSSNPPCVGRCHLALFLSLWELGLGEPVQKLLIFWLLPSLWVINYPLALTQGSCVFCQPPQNCGRPACQLASRAKAQMGYDSNAFRMLKENDFHLRILYTTKVWNTCEVEERHSYHSRILSLQIQIQKVYLPFSGMYSKILSRKKKERKSRNEVYDPGKKGTKIRD